MIASIESEVLYLYAELDVKATQIDTSLCTFKILRGQRILRGRSVSEAYILTLNRISALAISYQLHVGISLINTHTFQIALAGHLRSPYTTQRDPRCLQLLIWITASPQGTQMDMFRNLIQIRPNFSATKELPTTGTLQCGGISSGIPEAAAHSSPQHKLC